jgi:hypothetical protein
MTKLEKQTITRMRESGKTYIAIAESLDLPVNTVKSFCRRNGVKTLQALRAEADPNVCMQWNRHRGQMNRKLCVEKTCAHCGSPFISYPQENRKYCSHDCYIKARFGGGRHVSGTR